MVRVCSSSILLLLLLLLQVFIDTTGWAFTYPLAQLAGCRVASYTHYPTVSTNMLSRVWSQQAMYNNDDSIRNSTIKSLIKVLYYQLFALVYGLAGACAGERAVGPVFHAHVCLCLCVYVPALWVVRWLCLLPGGGMLERASGGGCSA